MSGPKGIESLTKQGKNRFLLNFNQNSSFTFSLGKLLHRQLNIKSCPSLRFVPVCCGYFGNCCSTWGWGVGWLGGVLVSMVCCGAFVRYLYFQNVLPPLEYIASGMSNEHVLCTISFCPLFIYKHEANT